MLQEILASLRGSLESQFVGGGLVLMLTGSVLALCRSVPRALWAFAKRQLTTRIDLVDGDREMTWLSTWLASQPYTRKARFLAASPTRHRAPTPFRVLPTEEPDNNDGFVPAPGTHWFWHNRRPMRLTRSRSARDGGGYSDSYTLETLGRSATPLRRLMAAAQELSTEDTVTVFNACGDYWSPVKRIAGRPLDTVILRDGLVEDVEGDIKEFLGSEQWYLRRGVPWRRGYLLHGPPGTGKTSFISALSAHLGMDLYILNLKSPNASDDNLLDLVQGLVPGRSILLLEDVDTVSPSREDDNPLVSRVSLSGLLNALDGVASAWGTVVVMTSNVPSKLDSAIVRSGRVDRSIEIGPPTLQQARRLFLSFYTPRLDVDRQADTFAALATTGAWSPSMADLQGVLLRNKENPDGAVNEAQEHFDLCAQSVVPPDNRT